MGAGGGLRVESFPSESGVLLAARCDAYDNTASAQMPQGLEAARSLP
jgi:hypothetical protein